tara:strand:- start:92 stop:706 length:615 start_codon:yes stop_codon:yes gene_type:complete
MINLTYRFEQNSSSLKLEGIPDVSCGHSDQTIGIVTSWTLQLIGSPLLEGKKDHLDKLMYVILQYSGAYMSGIRKSFISLDNIVSIYPYGSNNHKLLLNSTKKGIKPLEIILDDSELSDLTRCLDYLRFDNNVKVKWSFDGDHPFTNQTFLHSLGQKSFYLPFIYGFIIFFSIGGVLSFIPTNYNSNEIKSINFQNNSPKIKIK